jgi:hypothetical protein
MIRGQNTGDRIQNTEDRIQKTEVNERGQYGQKCGKNF